MTDEAMEVRDASAGYALQADRPAVPEGYKQTEVGVIPKDWVLFQFGDIFEFRNGVNADKNSYGKGIYFVNVLEPITHSHIYGPEIAGQVSLPEAVVAPYIIQAGDILFNRTSESPEELGLASAYLGTDRVVFGGFVIRGRPLGNRLDSAYAGYSLRAPSIRKQIIPMGQGAIRTNIGQKNLSLVVVPLPPLLEQRAIATALSDVDALLESLDRLIAKKRDIKQATMQQLLTGEVRLPGFEGEWEKRKLGTIAVIRSGGTPSTSNDEFWNGDIPWCTPTDITGLQGRKYLSATNRSISDAGLKMSSAELIPPGSIIMTTRATIGECAINTLPVTTNQGFKNLEPTSADCEYLYYLMTTQKQRLLQLCAGSTFLEVGKKQLEIFDLYLPEDVEEQRAIATVLSDMDAVIETLEQRRAKTASLKQAMMQELLTGRTRLI